eukprot:CAMPEP_0174706002 /NCGR_PEP_ID=MMETSP1094-20130205/9014_1 /TAXON_ID=156173 /ORGANISM="Chrysochromulina brevifilum, Strain UTEX LB 985" /LENGTH=226 /DNA_ID=CAMNT_0015904227 /DNA_START=14 /DNA_END=690 /DNA_ORIENTATION=+
MHHAPGQVVVARSQSEREAAANLRVLERALHLERLQVATARAEAKAAMDVAAALIHKVTRAFPSCQAQPGDDEWTSAAVEILEANGGGPTLEYNHAELLSFEKVAWAEALKNLIGKDGKGLGDGDGHLDRPRASDGGANVRVELEELEDGEDDQSEHPSATATAQGDGNGRQESDGDGINGDGGPSSGGGEIRGGHGEMYSDGDGINGDGETDAVGDVDSDVDGDV